MRKDREIALKLRLGGKSYGEINKILSVPKSTLSGWFSNLVLSDKLRERIKTRTRKKSIAGLIKRNKAQTTLAIARSLNNRRKAAAEIKPLSQGDLLVMGAALYWAEGYKRLMRRNGKEVTHHALSLTNSDPYLIKAFLLFLRRICKVPEEKIKANLRIYEHQNDHFLQDYWQKETGILPQNFQRIYTGVSRSSMGRRPFNRLPYGVIQIRVADTNLFHRIMGYIEGLKKLV